jgi:translation elongation factor EF-1alpha
MDEKTVNWSKDRFDFIKSQLTKYLRRAGFKKSKFIPVSGLCGDNLVKKNTDGILDWYYKEGGNTFIEELDMLELSIKLKKIKKSTKLVCTVFDKIYCGGYFKIMAKIENGKLNKGDKLIVLPSMKKFKVDKFGCDFEEQLNEANKRELISIYTKSIDKCDIFPGYVLCKQSEYNNNQHLQPCSKFIAEIKVVDTVDSTYIITEGSIFVMHLGTLTVDVLVEKVVSKFDKKSKREIKKINFLRKGDNGKIVINLDRDICCSKFCDYKFLSTFLLRSSYKTVAIGKVLKKGKN